jgi:hypothetical protein
MNFVTTEKINPQPSSRKKSGMDQTHPAIVELICSRFGMATPIKDDQRSYTSAAEDSEADRIDQLLPAVSRGVESAAVGAD